MPEELPHLSSAIGPKSSASRKTGPGSSKRRHAVIDEDDNITSKNARMDVCIVNNEEVKFAKSVVGTKGTPAFNQFLDFLIKGEGIKCLEILKINGINLANMSSILSKAGVNAVEAFKKLYDLWFDDQGKETLYLGALKRGGMNLAHVSSILSRAGANAARAFKELHNLWFDEQGMETLYLKVLEKERINLANMSSILSRAGANAARAFKELHNLWFDEQGNKRPLNCVIYLFNPEPDETPVYYTSNNYI